MTTAMLRRILLVLLSAGALIPKFAAQSNSKRPVDYVNTLVGTAPLDQQKLIGNAPPPGEQVYSGFTSPAAMLPHSSTELGPVNANLEELWSIRSPTFSKSSGSTSTWAGMETNLRRPTPSIRPFPRNRSS